MKNLFIVIDGIDGCGKSTQISKLHDFLFRRDKRVRILTTREPTYGRHGIKVREMLIRHLDPYSDSEGLLKLYIQDREDHQDKIIKPFLKEEDDNVLIVLCDRYYYSTIVYQSAQGLELDKVIKANKHFMKPDLAIILDLNPETALHRISKERATEKFEKIEFMNKIRAGFLDLKNVLDDNIAYVDTSGSEQETFEKIKKEVEKIL